MNTATEPMSNKIEIIMGDGSPTPESVREAVLSRIAAPHDLDALPFDRLKALCDARGEALRESNQRMEALREERDGLLTVAREIVTRWDDVQRGLRDPSCLHYANELALAALAAK